MKAKPIKFSQLELLEAFDYDTITGALKRKGGDLATSLSRDGYLTVQIEKVNYKAHRIIYKMLYNEEPEEIDHVNTVRCDNAKSNLRKANRFGNSRNCGISSRNITGVKGLSVNVDRRTSSVTWRAQIFANGVRFRKNFVFTDEGRALAVAWIEETREKIHGEFTNHG